MPARHDTLYALNQTSHTGTDMSTYQAATQQEQPHSMMVMGDRWGATGMGPLATVAHVLAANNTQTPPSDPPRLPTVRIGSQPHFLQPSASHGAAPTGGTGGFDHPHQAAAAAGSGDQPSHMPNPQISSAFSAHNPYQAIPQGSLDSSEGAHHQMVGGFPAGHAYQQLENASTMTVASSLESSLGSGAIPAYFNSAEGIPDLTIGPPLDTHTGRFMTSNGNFSTRSSGNFSSHSVQSGSNSLDNMRAAAKRGHDLSEGPDTDMTMVHDAPCAPPATHHHASTAVGAHSAPPPRNPHAPTALGPHSAPQPKVLATAFGTLAMDDGSTPMETGIAEETTQQTQMSHLSGTHLRPTCRTGTSGESVAAFYGSAPGSNFSSGLDLTQPIHTHSPAAGFRAPASQPPSLTQSGYHESQQLQQKYMADAHKKPHRNNASQMVYTANEHQENGQALSPALDVEMLHSMGYNLEDLMDDGGYSLGRAAETRRMRLVAEGPKPRQARMPLSPRSMVDHRFSGGTVSGGSTQHSGRSRLSVEARAFGSGPAAAADGSSFWSRPTSVSSPLDSHQFFLPSNLVPPPPPPHHSQTSLSHILIWPCLETLADCLAESCSNGLL